MGKIAWYKRDPRAALTGMMELTLEERGAYNTVLDLIYDRDGDLPDDDRFLAGWCKCDLRVWRRIKQRLIGLGKLYVEGGKLRNERADRGVDEALHRVTSAADAGRASGRKRVAKSNGDNGLSRAAVGTTDATNIEDRRKKKGDTPLHPPKAKAQRGTRIPADWKPSEADREYARSHGLTERQIDRAAENFLNYWTAKSGRDALKCDWSATWRNRVLQIVEYGAGPGRSNGGGGKSYHSHVRDHLQDDNDDFTSGHQALFGVPGSVTILRPGRTDDDPRGHGRAGPYLCAVAGTA